MKGTFALQKSTKQKSRQSCSKQRAKSYKAYRGQARGKKALPHRELP
jgi:hypothetical protein